MSAVPATGALAAARAGYRGLLAPRYREDAWDLRFRDELHGSLFGGARVLEIGAGARPAVAPSARPPDCVYVGLDIDAAELAKADRGSYDEQVVGDATVREPALDRRFDLVLSWMVLEHVESLPAALANIAAYLRPGGRLVAQMPGAFSAAALANRALPAGLSRRLLGRLQGRDPQTIFPAHYDRCWHSALDELLSRPEWAEHRVLPLFTGAFYVAFSAPLRATYLGFEELAFRRGWRNLAPYYLVTATAADRPPPPADTRGASPPATARR